MKFNLIKINDLRIRLLSKKIFFINKIFFFYIIKKMIIIVIKKNGVGFSSNQLNFDKQIIILNTNKKKKPLILINPKILKKSIFCTICSEGCLSIPNFFTSLVRPEKIFIKYINLYNIKKKKIFNNIKARCLQHEIDHLFGIVIIDYYNKNIIYE